MGRKLSPGSIFIVAALFCGFCTPLIAANYSEQEPNDTKLTANVVSPPMIAGDTITGFTTGSFSFPGESSPDYYLVQTAVLPPGIYQHRLVLTVAGPPPATDTYNASIVGLQQVDGVIQPNTEAILHQAPNNGYPLHPRRTVQWYGFGRGERIYFRISGSSSTSSTYTLTLVTTSVPPQVVEQAFDPGQITIVNSPTSPEVSFFDAWVYDANLNAIPGYGPNLTTSLTREFAAGIYYVALGKFEFGNNQASGDGPWPDSPVMDFPDAAVVRATAFNYHINVTINGNLVEADVTFAPYNIVWLKLTVGEPGCTCLGDMDSNNVVDGRDMPAFVTSVLNGEGDCADTNNDTQVNSGDVSTFIDRLLSGDPCS